jgi:hypothetical protein
LAHLNQDITIPEIRGITLFQCLLDGNNLFFWDARFETAHSIELP